MAAPFATRMPHSRTTWQQLRLRKSIFIAWLIAGALLLVLAIWDAATARVGLAEWRHALLIWAAVAIVLLAWLRRFRCPRCARRFYRQDARMRLLADHCAQCQAIRD